MVRPSSGRLDPPPYRKDPPMTGTDFAKPLTAGALLAALLTSVPMTALAAPAKAAATIKVDAK